MQRRTRLITGAAVAVAALGGAGGIAAASGAISGDDDDTPITGEAYDRAVQVALDAVGGGTVTETEVGDEESYYQVEVRLPDGSSVDVNLDESFAVVATKAEHGEDDHNDD